MSPLPITTVCSSCSPEACSSQHLELCLAWKCYVSVLNAFRSASWPILFAEGLFSQVLQTPALGFSVLLAVQPQFWSLQQERSGTFLRVFLWSFLHKSPRLCSLLHRNAASVSGPALRWGTWHRGNHPNPLSPYSSGFCSFGTKQSISFLLKIKMPVQGLTLRQL